MTDVRQVTAGQVIPYLMVLLVALFGTGRLAAQFTTASLDGIVLDPSGAGVPQATVTVQNTETGVIHIMNTGTGGHYLFPALPVGTYKLTVEKTRFRPYIQSGIVLTVNQAATQAVVLKVGKVTEQITVSGSPPLVTTSSSAVGQLVNQQSIVNLPLNGRTAQSLVFLVPGANDVTNYFCGVGCEGGAS